MAHTHQVVVTLECVDAHNRVERSRRSRTTTRNAGVIVGGDGGKGSVSVQFKHNHIGVRHAVVSISRSAQVERNLVVVIGVELVPNGTTVGNGVAEHGSTTVLISVGVLEGSSQNQLTSNGLGIFRVVIRRRELTRTIIHGSGDVVVVSERVRTTWECAIRHIQATKGNRISICGTVSEGSVLVAEVVGQSPTFRAENRSGAEGVAADVQTVDVLRGRGSSGHRSRQHSVASGLIHHVVIVACAPAGAEVILHRDVESELSVVADHTGSVVNRGVRIEVDGRGQRASTQASFGISSETNVIHAESTLVEYVS